MQLSYNCNNNSILLRCVNNTLDLQEKIRNINISVSTPGTYSTQNMFPSIYHTQLLCDTIVHSKCFSLPSIWH